MERFDFAEALVGLVVLLTVFRVPARRSVSPMAFSNAARTEYTVDPVYIGRLSSV